MVLPGLDVEAAERHLTNIPLSLNEEKVVERQVSNRTVSKASSLPFVVDTGYIPSSGLDVDAAERFLVSLDVVLWQLTSPERPGRDEFPMFDCEHTVIGGWRDGEALDLMRKGLIGKGLIGGRIVLSTRQSTTYICSSTAVSDAAKFDKTKNYGKEVQIPLIPRVRFVGYSCVELDLFFRSRHSTPAKIGLVLSGTNTVGQGLVWSMSVAVVCEAPRTLILWQARLKRSSPQ